MTPRAASGKPKSLDSGGSIVAVSEIHSSENSEISREGRQYDRPAIGQLGRQTNLQVRSFGAETATTARNLDDRRTGTDTHGPRRCVRLKRTNLRVKGMSLNRSQQILLCCARHPDSELGRLRMISHLYVDCDGYRFGTRTRRLRPKRAVVLWPGHRGRRNRSDRVYSCLKTSRRLDIVAFPDGILT